MGEAKNFQPSKNALWDNPGVQPGLSHCRMYLLDSPYKETDHGPKEGTCKELGSYGVLLLATARNKLCTFYYPKHSDSSHKETDSFQCLLRGTQSLNLPLKLPFLPKFNPYVEQDASIKLLLLTEKLPAPHVLGVTVPSSGQ